MEIEVQCRSCKTVSCHDWRNQTQTIACPGCDGTVTLPGAYAEGTVIGGKYTIINELSRGGMGVVYRARQHSLDRVVALKILHLSPLMNPELVERARLEAQALARIRHPHIVEVYDAGEDEGCLYIAMAYIDGPSLLQHIEQQGPLPATTSRRLARQVATALRDTHAEHGILHRDVKPANIMLERGDAQLLDFGLVKLDDDEQSGPTRVGAKLGTPNFMSPEQLKGTAKLTPATDIYGLGATLLQLLTGRPPFEAPHALAVIAKRNMQPVPEAQLAELAERAPSEAALVRRMMALKPTDRFQTWDELLTAFDASPVAEGGASSSSTQAADTGSRKRAKWLLPLVLLATVAGLVIAAKTIFNQPTNSPPGTNPALNFTLGPGVEIAFASIPAGSFQMGTAEGVPGRDADEILHRVQLTHPFHMSTTEITQAQFEAVMANEHESHFEGPNRPVEKISWDEADAFCAELNRRFAPNEEDGRVFRLPTEAEWEYACRAGGNATFGVGDGENLGHADAAFDHGVTADAEKPPTGSVEVASYPANDWGLYDMHGNVWEWCYDTVMFDVASNLIVCVDTYKGNGLIETNPVGRAGANRVFRGGSWSDKAIDCRSACRFSNRPTHHTERIGFRVVLGPTLN